MKLNPKFIGQHQGVARSLLWNMKEGIATVGMEGISGNNGSGTEIGYPQVVCESPLPITHTLHSTHFPSDRATPSKAMADPSPSCTTSCHAPSTTRPRNPWARIGSSWWQGGRDSHRTKATSAHSRVEPSQENQEATMNQIPRVPAFPILPHG